MNAVKFNTLLEQFIAGNTDFANYRKKRTDLIHQITAPETLAQLGNANNQAANYPIRPKLRIPKIDQESDRSPLPFKQISIVLLLIMSGILSWYFSTADVENMSAQPVDTEITIKKVVIENNIIDEPFITAFNQKSHWDTASVSDFLVQWQSLTQAQQTTARKSPAFLHLSELLKQRIQALRNHMVGKAKPTSRQENLYIWLSSQLSISPDKE